MVDKQFTKKYLETLKGFSKYLVTQISGLPSSGHVQLQSFFSKLGDELRRDIKLLQTANISKDISINPNIIFSYKNPKAKSKRFHISLGGKIKIKDSMICEQSLCINVILEHTDTCKSIPDNWKMYPTDTGYHIIRRFHFDFDSANDDISKPKFHLQYGGNFEEQYLEIENIHYNLCNPLDTPRLPQQPYDIIMLLDFILREFTLGGKVVKEKKWNQFVIESEKIWLEPYYKNLLSKLSNNQRSTPLHRAG
ncbi:hypothetical protein JKP31_19520 [Vibrio vulnificus]|uniref:hypothetical protein n=1 Tax=Vibrio vulnificus TaxID=672 RepID=UPI001CDBDADD|nr:hypothetical protein [Vibrio vulnificus]MCA3903475.1 hypothetical protein [Vibrio vulnificus]